MDMDKVPSYILNYYTVTCKEGNIQLVNGSIQSEGRVEICYNDTWHIPQSDYNWEMAEANVVCRQLGYTGATLALEISFYPELISEENILDRRWHCVGDELYLHLCPYNQLMLIGSLLVLYALI